MELRRAPLLLRGMFEVYCVALWCVLAGMYSVAVMTARQGKRVRRGSAPGLINEAAREVFAERGYGATTREIASRAGVSHDLIFRYFDSKEKLFFDAVVAPLLDAVGGLHRTLARTTLP